MALVYVVGLYSGGLIFTAFSQTLHLMVVALTGKFGNCAAKVRKFNTFYVEGVKFVQLRYRLHDTNFPHWVAAAASIHIIHDQPSKFSSLLCNCRGKLQFS